MIELWQPWTWTAETWSAAASCATFAVALLAALYARRQVGEAVRTREDQAQPFVVIDFEPNPAAPIVMDLVIRNTGATLAKDVSFTFDPPLQSSYFGGQEFDPARCQILTTGIPSLPPGREYRVLFDRMPDRQESGLANRYTVTVHFSSTRRVEQPLVSVLDLDLYFSLMHIDVKTLHHAASALEDIAKLLKNWDVPARGGMRVWTRDDDAYEARIIAERAARRGRHSDSAENDPM